MKLSLIAFLSTAMAVGALLNSGCVTDESATSKGPATAEDMGAPATGVNTVKMVVDGSGPQASVTLNGVMVGYSPREIHLEVTPDGRLAYAVTITISYREGAMRQMAANSSSAQAQGGSYTYMAGDRVPATLEILGPSVKHESRNLAPFDTKPTVPSARRVE